MKITLAIRNLETSDVDTIEVETDVYDRGYSELRDWVPEGWQLLSVGVDRS